MIDNELFSETVQLIRDLTAQRDRAIELAEGMAQQLRQRVQSERASLALLVWFVNLSTFPYLH